MLYIVRGRAAAGKTAEIIRRIAGSLDRGRRTLLIVPEQTTLSSERELLEMLGRNGSMRASIMSPKRLCTDVFSRMGGADQAVIDERGRAMVLRRVGAQIRSELKVLGSVSNQNHFAQHASSLFSDLKRFSIGPKDLMQASDRVTGANLSGKLYDLSVLMQAYEDWMTAHHHMDDEDELYLLAQKLLADEKWKDADIFIDGFDYLPPGSIAWITSFMQISKSVTVSVCTAEESDPDRDIFAAGAMSEKYLLAAAERVGCPVTLHRVQRDETLRPDILNALERGLYAYPAPEFTGSPEGVYFLSPSDPEEEAEQAARLIDGWVRREGLRYRDIALLCGDLEQSASRIRRVFSRFDLPLFLDERRSVLQHPLVHFALTALQTVYNGYRARDLLDCLKTGFCGLDRELLENWERQISAGSGRGKRALFGPYRRPVQGVERQEELQEAGNRMQQAFAPLEQGHKNRVSAREWAALMSGWMESFAVREQLEQRCLDLEALGDRDAASQTAQIWEEWTDMLDQLSGILGDSPLDAREAAQVLEAGFIHAEVGVLPVGLDRILCGDVGRTKLGSVKRLIVLNVCDGVIPTPYRADVLLNDRDIAVLEDLQMTVGRDAGIRMAQSQFGIYHVLACPTETVVLSCPRKEDSGAALRASSVMERIRTLFSPEILVPDRWAPAAPEALLETAAEAVRTVNQGERQDARLPGLLSALEQVGYAAETQALTKGAGSVSHVSSSLLGHTISVSSIEDYAECPFEWFVKKILRPEEWEMDETNPIGAGLVLHEAAARFGWRVKDRQELTQQDAETEMNAVLDALYREEPWVSRREDPRENFLMNRMRDVCVKTARLWSCQLQRSDFRPTRFEDEFGKTLPGPSMELPDGTRVEWTGTIDRVDVLRDGDRDVLRVVDYKSSVTAVKGAGIAEGWQIQLWIYLQTLCSLWEEKTGRKAVPGGVYYAPMGDKFENGAKEEGSDPLAMEGFAVREDNILYAMDRDLKAGESSPYINLKKNAGGSYSTSGSRTREEFENWMRGAVETGKQLAQRMRDGEVPPQPLRKAGRSHCEFCEYKAMCALQSDKHEVVSMGETRAAAVLKNGKRREENG